jgi:hypothetical protein
VSIRIRLVARPGRELPADLVAVHPGQVPATGRCPWQRHLQQVAPMTAGLAIQDTAGLSNLPISPWAGLGVLAAWTAGALLAGDLLLRLPDA